MSSVKFKLALLITLLSLLTLTMSQEQPKNIQFTTRKISRGSSVGYSYSTFMYEPFYSHKFTVLPSENVRISDVVNDNFNHLQSTLENHTTHNKKKFTFNNPGTYYIIEELASNTCNYITNSVHRIIVD
jgi:hypothetical protein